AREASHAQLTYFHAGSRDGAGRWHDGQRTTLKNSATKESMVGPPPAAVCFTGVDGSLPRNGLRTTAESGQSSLPLAARTAFSISIVRTEDLRPAGSRFVSGFPAA